MTTINNTAVINAEMVLLSKHEAEVHYLLKNTSKTVLHTIKLKAVNFDGKPILIVESSEIYNLKAGETATLSANVILPSNYTVDEINGELQILHSEGVFETTSGMTKAEFDTMQDWR